MNEIMRACVCPHHTAPAIGFAIASLQAGTKALGAPSAPPLDQYLQNMGINLACVLFFGRGSSTVESSAHTHSPREYEDL